MYVPDGGYFHEDSMQAKTTHFIEEQTYGRECNLPLIIHITLIRFVYGIDSNIKYGFNECNCDI